MATLTVSGISSGIDYESLIQQLLEVERIPVNRLERQKTEYEQKSAAYTDLSNKLEALESAADALRLSTSFGGKETTVSDETIFTTNVSSSATTGNYSMTVNQLALAHKLKAGVGLASTDTAVAAGSGQFTFKVGDTGTEYTVDLEAGMTLEELKNAINDLDGGIHAVIINDGTDTDPYQLILSSDDTGADNKIIVTQDGTNLGLPVNDTDLTSGLHLQAPQDAEIVMDGLTVYRSSNTVTDLAPGVSMFLHKADPATAVTLQVSEDLEAVREGVQALVDSYNDVINFIHSRNEYDTEDNKADPLFAEGTVRSIERRMSQIVSTGVTGLPSDMRALSQIGISTEREGTLSLNVGKLQDALDENLEGVTNLFVKGETTQGIAEQFYQLAFGATRSEDGDLAIRMDGLQDRVRELNAKIEVQESALERMEERLRARFATLENLILSVQSTNLSALYNSY
jgi:flagellar hook-associated protein 2